VIALLGGWLLGINPLTILGLIGGGGGGSVMESPAPTAPGQTGVPSTDPGARFVSTVLASTEDTWSEIFRKGGAEYRPPKLVLFSGVTETACGMGQSAAGPFYCPEDQSVYIDLDFYRMLQQRFQAPGDFAQAYVVAHEVGHHVQNLVGTMDKVQSQRQRMSERQYNRLSVRLELQADCYAGIWARQSQQAKGWLEEGDVEEGLNAASQIGDDTLQKRTQGTVVPDAFTHGSSEQRVHWFRIGMETHRLADCDTFTRTEP
jgi:predicted metalloprotease